MEYANVPRIIGTLVSRRMATLAELDTVLGTEDIFDLIEIVSVDDHNQHLINKRES